MRQTTKEVFWELIMNANYNITSSVLGPYPYTSIFKTNDGRTVGKIIESYANPPARWPMEREYLVASERL